MPAEHLPATTALLLPLEWQTPFKAKETAVAAETFIEAVLSCHEPVAVRFVLSCGGGAPATAGFVVDGPDADTVRVNAELIGATARVLNVWQGLAEPRPWEPLPMGPNVFELRAVEGPGRRIFNFRSAPWALAAEQGSRHTMRIDLYGLDTDPDRSRVRCRVAVAGDGAASSIIATLVAADPPGDLRLEALPLGAGHAGVLRDPQTALCLPLDMVAHLIATPARMAQVWPAHPVRKGRELLDVIDRAIPPHTAVFGGSGLGKTTLMEHLVAESLAARNTAVVICPHGDLAARAAQIASSLDQRFNAVDFAATEPQATWNLCTPPPGTSPQQWAAELVHIVRNSWADMPAEYFGPVWSKSVRLGLSVLTGDPEGPHPLTQLADVLTPPLSPRWHAALTRIGDDQLTRELAQVHTSIEKHSEGSWGMWLTSKLEPFTADERVQRVLGSPQSTLDLDAVAHGESLIVAAPVAALGDTGASLVTATLVTQLWHRIRANHDADRRVDLFIDEAHRVPAHTVIELLSEARKFGVRLRLATQSPFQLDGGLRDATLTNCGAIGTFRTGPAEAALLDPLFPSVTPATMTRLDRHWLALTDGEHDLVGPTLAPLVEGANRDALTTAHATCHRRTRNELLVDLRTVLAHLATSPTLAGRQRRRAG